MEGVVIVVSHELVVSVVVVDAVRPNAVGEPKVDVNVGGVHHPHGAHFLLTALDVVPILVLLSNAITFVA